MEHGLDERHPDLLLQRPGTSPLPPPRAHLRAALRLPRELRPPAQPRRSQPWQRITAGQDARGPLAAVREPPRAARLDVGPPRPAVAVHGRGDRTVRGVEPRTQPGLAPAAVSGARRRAPDTAAGASPGCVRGSTPRTVRSPRP